MALTTSDKRALTAWALDQCVPGTVTLLDTARTQRDAVVSDIQSGRVVSSTSTGSSSVSFFQPESGRLTPSDLMAWWGDEFLRRHANALTVLGGSPTDAAVAAQILVKLQPVHSYRSTYNSQDWRRI